MNRRQFLCVGGAAAFMATVGLRLPVMPASNPARCEPVSFNDILQKHYAPALRKQLNRKTILYQMLTDKKKWKPVTASVVALNGD